MQFAIHSKLSSEFPCTVVFSQDKYIFQDQNQVILATGAECDGLYYFSTSPQVSLLSGCNVVVIKDHGVSSSKLWHIRLGNPSDNVIKHISDVSFNSGY